MYCEIAPSPNVLLPASSTCAPDSGSACRFHCARCSPKFVAATVFLISLAIIGCKSKEPVQQNVASPETAEFENEITPLLAAKQALQRKDIRTAKQQIRRALLAAPNDVEALMLSAEVAYTAGDRQGAITWMIRAAKQSHFVDETLVQQCARELLSTGKVFETIDLLEECVRQQPQQHETRRNLLNYLVNTEQHRRAQHHGQILIRQRVFDKNMLFQLATYEQRDVSPSSMNGFFKLNPTDRRLEIAKLRVLFDNGQWDQFQQVADQILSTAPNFLPAQLLLGQFYVQTDKFDQLLSWSQTISIDAQQHWQYWEVLGDWALDSKLYPEAARAYYEASRCDLTVDSVAIKLARSLQFCDDRLIPLDAIKISKDRGELLIRFLQEKERYHKLHRKSCAVVAEMATTLEQLGRLWEAEAWTAVGLAEPDQDVGKLIPIRDRIVAKLSKNSPWQSDQGHPFVTLDLGFLPLPTNNLFAKSDAQNETSKTVPSLEPILVEVSQQRGLVDAPGNPTTLADGIIPLHSQLGFGGAALDFDCDGWTDIYLASCGTVPMSAEKGTGSLFRNVGGKFVSTRDVCKIKDRGFSQGVASGDINEDGFTDLVLLRYGADQIFINNGDGTYSERNEWIDDTESDWSTSAAIADIDLDGISDFVCLKYCTALEPLKRRCTVPPDNSVVYCVPTDYEAEVDQFFQGQPNGQWTIANQAWNCVPKNPGRGLGIVAGQLDNEPGIDIFVANDMTSNHFWNSGDQEPFGLQETATIRGLALDRRSRPQASMGIAADDLDADGDIDLFVTSFEHEHNTLYEQTLPGVWEDRSDVAGVAESSFQRLGFGVQAIDLDNDSQLEMVVVNGHVHHNAQSGYAQLPQVFRRSTSGGFEEIPSARLTNYFRNRHVGRALWSLDFDRDHLLDLVVTHQRESTALLHNETSDATMNHWLRVKLIGTKSARDAVGSVVSVWNNERRRTASVKAGDGFFSSSEKVLHFGLGPTINSREVQIKVTWPDGATQTHRSSVDQECLIVEGGEAVFAYLATGQ